MKKKILGLWAVLLLTTSGAWAAAKLPDLEVVPWDGHKAATSLTFDDSDVSHLDLAIPEMDKRKMKGTFFLIANKTDRKDDWRRALASGHEIGNHTLDHKHASELTPQDEEAQVSGAKNVLQKEFGVPVLTFAYPFVEISAGLKDWVGKTQLLARGGNSAYVTNADQEPDWLNIPSQTTKTNLTFKDYQSWMDQDLSTSGWLVWMIHGLEGTRWGWEPISKDNFTQILDYLQSKDFWVGTFLEVGSYFRAQKIFQKANVVEQGGKKTWSWETLEWMPLNVTLKMRLAGKAVKGIEVTQDGQKLQPDDKGLYAVNFSKKELTLRRAPETFPRKKK